MLSATLGRVSSRKGTVVEVRIGWSAGGLGQLPTVQRSRSPGSPAAPFPASSSSPFSKVPGPSLLGSPCKRASIPPAAWVEQEAGSGEAAAVSQTAPTQAPAWGPSGDRALALGWLASCRIRAVQPSVAQDCPASLGASQGARAPVLLCSSPLLFPRPCSFLSLPSLLLPFKIVPPLLCFSLFLQLLPLLFFETFYFPYFVTCNVSESRDPGLDQAHR